MGQKRKLRLVEIEWVDISGGSSWDNIEKDYTGDLIKCKTVGWELLSNRKTLVLASTISEHEKCTDRTVIPRSIIKSIKQLKR